MPIGEADNFALVCQLFAREVPEIASGAIAVRAVARAPGRRTKVALTSRDRDPIGPCVGPKGLHAKVIAAELGGEPIDMISWSESPHEFVRRALAPAQVATVRLDHATRRATAYVLPDQLGLALGKDGENRDLAGQLTGWTIDVVAADAA